MSVYILEDFHMIKFRNLVCKESYFYNQQTFIYSAHDKAEPNFSPRIDVILFSRQISNDSADKPYFSHM